MANITSEKYPKQVIKERPCFVTVDVLNKKVLPILKKANLNKKSKRRAFNEVVDDVFNENHICITAVEMP